jgi:hypothetical protein
MRPTQRTDCGLQVRLDTFDRARINKEDVLVSMGVSTIVQEDVLEGMLPISFFRAKDETSCVFPTPPIPYTTNSRWPS